MPAVALALVIAACQGVPNPAATAGASAGPPTMTTGAPSATASMAVPDATAPAGTSPAPAEPTDEVGLAGLTIVGNESRQARPVGEPRRQAFNEALQLALDNPRDFGYPWVEPVTGQLLVSPVTANGEALTNDHPWKLGGRPGIRHVERSIAALDAIAQDVTMLGSRGVPGSEAIYMTEPDHRDNRIIITVMRLDAELADFLARTYGTDAIAVRIKPLVGGAQG
jgi:hypothetical protein